MKSNPVLSERQAKEILRRQNRLPPMPPALEVRGDPPHLVKELAWLRENIRKAGQTNTTIDNVAMTPKLAEAMMFMRQKKNRTIDPRWVDRFVGIITEGRYRNFESFIFDWDGDFRQGQHRLTALIKAGAIDRNIEIIGGITFGVDPEAFAAMDMPRRRSAAQVMALDDIKYAGTIAAIVRLKYRIEHAGRTPDDELVTILGRELTDDLLSRAIIAGVRLRRMKVITSSAAMAYRMIASEASRGLSVDEFWDRLAVGDQMLTSNPVFKLRALFDRRRADKDRKASQYLTQTQHAAWIIKAWNSWTIGETAVSFTWTDENSLPAVR